MQEFFQGKRVHFKPLCIHLLLINSVHSVTIGPLIKEGSKILKPQHSLQ